HAVCVSPVLSLVPLANHKSIRASRYAAAAAGSQLRALSPEGRACCAETVAANTVNANAIASLISREYPRLVSRASTLLPHAEGPFQAHGNGSFRSPR